MSITLLLKGEKIKCTKVGNKKYYSIISILEELEASKRPRKYWYDVKRKLQESNKEILENIKSLKVEASDGKIRTLDCVCKSDLNDILKALPSKKVKDFLENEKINKQVKKQAKKETKKISKKDLEKNKDKLKKETKKLVKKETKKITKKVKSNNIKDKIKKSNNNSKKIIKKEVKKELNNDSKKKKCGIICTILKIFA